MGRSETRWWFWFEKRWGGGVKRAIKQEEAVRKVGLTEAIDKRGSRKEDWEVVGKREGKVRGLCNNNASKWSVKLRKTKRRDDGGRGGEM